MFYNLMIVLQFVAIFLSLYSTLQMTKLKNVKNMRYLTLTSVATIVYAVTYLFEMLSRTEAEALLSVKMEYMAIACLSPLYLFFLCDYCEVKWMKRKIKYGILLYMGSLAVAMMTSEYHNFYYVSYEFVDYGLYPHLETVPNVGYWLFISGELIMSFLDLMCLWKNINKQATHLAKKCSVFLFVESVLPIFGVIINAIRVLDGYDVAPFICSLMITLLLLTLLKGRFLDVASLAYLNIYRNLSSGIIIVDEEKCFLEANVFAQSVFPEVKGMEKGVEFKLEGIDLISTVNEVYFERNDRYYSSVCSRLFDNGKHIGFTITINDVTEMKERLEEMKILKEDADAANQAKSSFLATMSHEIRTPLNAIIGMAALSEKEEKKETVMDYVGQIRSAGEMLLDIVSEVLDISKAESGKLELVPEEYDLLELLNGVINVANMRIGDKPINFFVDINPNIPKHLYGDNVRIRQVLVNFLGNAEKYTEEGSITLGIDYENDGHGILLKGYVKDTGRGILSDDIGKLFKPFSQVDTKNNHKIAGTGLGLSIAADIIELMGGNYHVESVYGRGSTFFFEFPQDVVETEVLAPGYEREIIKVSKFTSFYLYGKDIVREEENTKEKEKEEKPSVYPGKNVLVVDDNKVNVKVLTAFLKHFEIAADFCYSGFDALKKVEEKDYDLIFMDHMMPDMDGVETTMKIRENDKASIREIPIIACTANVIKGVEEMFFQAGMNDLIPKPVKMENLSEKLAIFLGNDV